MAVSALTLAAVLVAVSAQGAPPGVDPRWEAMAARQDWPALRQAISVRSARQELSAPEAVLQARALLGLGQASEALLVLEKLSQGGLRLPGIWRHRCEALLRLKRPTEAERVARHWVETFPEDGAGHFMLGISLVDRGLREEGLASLAKSVKWGGEHEGKARKLMADLHMERGLEERSDARWPEARASMELAMKLDPDNPAFHKALGQVYMKLNLWPEALDEFDQAVASGLARDAEVDLHDDIAAVHQHLAAVFLCREEPAQAKVHAQTGLQHTTTRTAVRRFKGLIRTAGKLELEALRIKARRDSTLWPKVLALAPRDHEANWELLKHRPQEEREAREREILAGPWGGEARVKLAEGLWDSDPQTAFVWAVEALRLLPLERALELEEQLFERVGGLSEAPKMLPWSLVWQWKKCGGIDDWNRLRKDVETHLFERYYVWIYCCEFIIENSIPDNNRIEMMVNDIESLDPPFRARARMNEIRRKINSRSQ